MTGPLHGIRVVELAGIGPGPFCGMMLADMGAEVIRVDRPGGNPTANLGHDVLNRNRRAVAINLRSPDAARVVLKLVASADAIFEGFRPGVAERLGVGPEACLAANPRVVYGRMTGWGQTGPLANAAGHDINYIALSGALHAIGRAGERPLPPLNLVGDFGGGGLMLAFAMVCAILEAKTSGCGQVIDASMVEGSAALMAMMYAMRARGLWAADRGTNLLDTGAPFYDTYACKDGGYLAIGPIEPQFHALLLAKLGADAAPLAAQFDRTAWPDQRALYARLFATKTRAEWCELLAGTDACVAPVLSMDEAPAHPHNVARGSFVTVDGMTQPAPTPRFSRTQPGTPIGHKSPGADTREVLGEHGFAAGDIDSLAAAGVIGLS